MCETKATRRSSLSNGMELFLKQTCSRKSSRRFSMGPLRGLSRSSSDESVDSMWSEASAFSTQSTSSVNSIMKSDPFEKKSKSTKRVSFHLESNTSHSADKHSLCEPHFRWYSKADLQKFRKDNVAKLCKITKEGTPNHSKILMTLLQTYQKLMLAKSADDVEEIFRSSQMVSYGPELIGFERMILQKVEQDRNARRQKILRALNQAQDFGCSDEIRRSKKIYKTCKSASRPSRLFAHYIALVSAKSL